MRELTLYERVILGVGPMFMKYQVLHKIFDEGHATGLGKGSSDSMFGIPVTNSVSLQWRDRQRKSIYINRFPWYEYLFIAIWIYWVIQLVRFVV